MNVVTNQDVQTALNQLGYVGANGQPLTVDGIIGTNSIFATRAFQKDHPPLAVDGDPGPLTKAALTAATTVASVSGASVQQAVAQVMGTSAGPAPVAAVPPGPAANVSAAKVAADVTAHLDNVRATTKKATSNASGKMAMPVKLGLGAAILAGVAYGAKKLGYLKKVGM